MMEVFNLAQIVLPLTVTIVFMMVLRPLARSIDLIDKPGGRKAHIGEVPVIGGLAMTAGVLLGAVVMGRQRPDPYPLMLSACVVLVGVGAIDDRFNLPPSVRFLAQGCAVLIVVFGANLLVTNLGDVTFGETVILGWFAPIFTLLMILTAVNAYNMFDGSDGVAGVQALNALVFLGFACVLRGNFSWLPVIANFVGVVLGFLLFNWPSRRTRTIRAFMGDAGSTMLGFTLACLGIVMSQGAERTLSPMAVLWIFTLPIFDFFSSMLRRVLNGRSPFHADAGHLHHILKRHLGFTSRRVAQLVLVCSALTSAIGLGAYTAEISDGYLLLGWVSAFVVYHLIFGTRMVIKGVQHFDTSEPDTGSFPLWKPKHKT